MRAYVLIEEVADVFGEDSHKLVKSLKRRGFQVERIEYEKRTKVPAISAADFRRLLDQLAAVT